MTQWSKKLAENLKIPFETKVYYFASTEENLVSAAATQVKNVLQKSSECDFIQLEKDFEIAQLAEIASTISFFGGWRVIELKGLNPASLTDKEIKTLSALFANLDGTVLIITTVFADKKSATGKRVKALLSAAQNAGFATELAKPTQRENIDYIVQCAKSIGAEIDSDAACTLLERAGEDWLTLENEVKKLAAIANYNKITKDSVRKNSISTVDADVFELARCITARRTAPAFERTASLFAQRVEPIAIAAALSGSFVDMYRVRCGAKQGLSTGHIFKEMGYFGSEYRLQKAKESAMKYSGKQLEMCIICLANLDKQLKSSAISDKGILLETAVATLLQIGAAG